MCQGLPRGHYMYSMRRWVLSIFLLSIVNPAVWGQGRPTADLILVNGRILTLDGADRSVSALAVRDGRILALGTNREIRAFAGPDTRTIDLRGQTATPGLIDTHAHISSGGLSQVVGVDLSTAKSVGEVVQRSAARIHQSPPGSWILGRGWDEAKLREHRYIEAQDLDAVSEGHPVWLDQTTGHYGTANTVALGLAGITADTAEIGRAHV